MAEEIQDLQIKVPDEFKGAPEQDEDSPAVSTTGVTPTLPEVRLPPIEVNAEKEEAQLGLLPTEPYEDPLKVIVPDMDDIDILTSAPDEITEQDLKDIDDGKYDPVIKANEKGFLEEAKEYGSAVVFGVADGLDQMGNTVTDLADYVANLIVDDRDPEAFSKWQENLNFIPDEWEEENKKILESSQGKAFVGTISQFLGGFIPLMKVIKLAQNGAKIGSKLEKFAKTSLGAASAGIVTDFAVWDVADKRVTDFMLEFGGDLSAEAAEELKANPDSPEALTKFKQTVGEALTSKWVRSLQYDSENDSKLMGRTKQAIEGGFLGKIVEGLALAVKQLGRLKPTKKTEIVEETAKAPAKKGKSTKDVLPLEKAKVKLVKQDQEAFNKAFYFDRNVEAAANIIARNLDDSLLNSVKDLDTVNNLSEIINELIENTHQAGKQSWKQAQLKAGKAYVENTENLVDPNLTPWEQTKITLEEGAAKTADLDVQVLKEGVIDQAMSLRIMKAKEALKAGEMTEEAFEKLYATALQVYNYVTTTAGSTARALNARKMFTADGSMSLQKIFKPVKEKGYNSTKELIEILDKIPENQPLPKNMLNKLAEPGFIQMGEEMFRNSVLSITSLGVNTTSNFSDHQKI